MRNRILCWKSQRMLRLILAVGVVCMAGLAVTGCSSDVWEMFLQHVSGQSKTSANVMHLSRSESKV
jgi:hypothetical protein